MLATHLTVVPTPAEADRDAEPLSGRIRRLQAEAQDLALSQVDFLCARLGDIALMAAEIADGGEAYPVGVRELCRRLTDEATFQSGTLTTIMERTAR